MKLGIKKLLLFGFVAILLVGIPVTIFLMQKQSQVVTHAEKSTNLSFSPVSAQATPIQKQVGDNITLDVMVDPGKNLVSFVKVEIQYDPDKLSTPAQNALQPNMVVFPSVLEGPVYTPGRIAVTLSVGPDPTKAIQTKVKAATLTLKALANTASTPTLVTYGATTTVLSIGTTDQASENVLAAAAPAVIQIGGSAPAESGTPVPIPSGTPLPTDVITPEPTAEPTLPLEVTPTTVSTGSGSTNQSPVCNALMVDRATTGASPLSLTFTANGTDADGTISKVTFNFGDGQVSDMTAAGGIGTNSVNTSASHTYNNPGTFQASAVLTDSNNGVSLSNTNCRQTITVTEPGAGTPGAGGGAIYTTLTPTTITATGSPTPTLAPTGTTEVVFGIAAFALLLMIGGGILFFAL